VVFFIRHSLLFLLAFQVFNLGGLLPKIHFNLSDLGVLSPKIHLNHLDLGGLLPRSGSPCFLMVGLTMAQAVHNLMYFPTSCQRLANRNTFVVLPPFSRPRNAQQPNYSVLPKSSWHARLKEHKGDPGGITGHLGHENLEHADPPRVSSMCGQILGRFCREVANQKSCAHKS